MRLELRNGKEHRELARLDFNNSILQRREMAPDRRNVTGGRLLESEAKARFQVRVFLGLRHGSRHT
jgi:hypothetical protein